MLEQILITFATMLISIYYFYRVWFDIDRLRDQFVEYNKNRRPGSFFREFYLRHLQQKGWVIEMRVLTVLLAGIAIFEAIMLALRLFGG